MLDESKHAKSTNEMLLGNALWEMTALLFINYFKIKIFFRQNTLTEFKIFQTIVMNNFSSVFVFRVIRSFMSLQIVFHFLTLLLELHFLSHLHFGFFSKKM